MLYYSSRLRALSSSSSSTCNQSRLANTNAKFMSFQQYFRPLPRPGARLSDYRLLMDIGLFRHASNYAAGHPLRLARLPAVAVRMIMTGKELRSARREERI